jgi:LAO/AO transport system kinase
MDAAGFDRVIIETVGVGQAEVEIVNVAHTTVLVEAPDLGDDIQTLKAGLLEIADLVLVNQADNPKAEQAFRAMQVMLSTGYCAGLGEDPCTDAISGPDDVAHRPDSENIWQVPLLKTVALTGEGVDPLVQHLDLHYAYLERSGELSRRRRAAARWALEMKLHDSLYTNFVDNQVEGKISSLVEAVLSGETDPYSAADHLLKEWNRYDAHKRS